MATVIMPEFCGLALNVNLSHDHHTVESIIFNGLTGQLSREYKSCFLTCYVPLIGYTKFIMG